MIMAWLVDIQVSVNVLLSIIVYPPKSLFHIPDQIYDKILAYSYR